MAADFAIGLGTLVKVDHDGDTSFDTISAIPELTPPGQEREEVDITVLEDTMEQMRAGIDRATTFEFMLRWDPTDTNHAIISTLYGSKAIVNWQIVLPFETPITGAFAGYVSAIRPEKVEKGQPIRCNVTVRRTGPVTWT